ncbi:MAG: heat-inducible transcriptional repressor HrcA [Thermoflexales bacterium]|nr:heat-inducible transcriptional repressor HrcA [Thermoflexales bacterium]
MALTSRQQQILSYVVQTYVATAKPVSSHAILSSGVVAMSSATIRNDLAALEDEGLLTHPHTSAGRIPTDKGYRYFVERLLGDVELPPQEENTIRHQFHQARLEMGNWMQLAAAVLARSSRAAALISAPHLELPRFRHVELISTQSQMALLVLVLQGGTVRQQVLALREPTDQAALSHAAARLNATFAGADQTGMRTRLGGLSEFELDVAGDILDLMMSDARAPSAEVVRDGLTDVLREPEFVSQTEARAIVQALEQPGFLTELGASRVGTVQVVIGGEGRWRELSSCSMVLARYGVEGFATGTVGVLGPTRMPYGRAISAVKLVAGLMSGLVGDIYSD